jgi:SynChlorMet cassette protein ScmC
LTGFSLNFSDGTRWWLGADDSIKNWLSEFADLLKLNPGERNDEIALIFHNGTLRDKQEPHIQTELNYTNLDSMWRIHHPAGLEMWSLSELPVIYCSVFLEPTGDMSPTITWPYVCYPFYHRAFRLCGGLPLHSALIEHNGRGYLLVGPSNIGKTTCCQRLPHGWNALCDDEILVVYNQMKDMYFAHPFPTWSDFIFRNNLRTSCKVQQSVPVAAILFLEQQDSDQISHAEKLLSTNILYKSTEQIFHRFLVNLPPIARKRLSFDMFINACRLTYAVPTYHLRTSLTGQFWEKIESIE